MLTASSVDVQLYKSVRKAICKVMGLNKNLALDGIKLVREDWGEVLAASNQMCKMDLIAKYLN